MAMTANKKPKSKAQKIKTDFGTMVATPIEPPAKKLKPLSPEMAVRMIAALDKLYNEEAADAITNEDYDRIKANIMARVREYGK